MTKHRPWRIEYLNAESEWVITRHTFETKRHATSYLRMFLEPDQPGIEFRIRKHVEFEAAK